MIQDSYYGTQIENRRQAFEWYQFQWSWVTSNPDFKVTILFVAPLFNAEYLRNGTRYRHSYNEILLGTYAFLKIEIFNDLDVRCYSANIMSNVKRGYVNRLLRLCLREAFNCVLCFDCGWSPHQFYWTGPHIR